MNRLYCLQKNTWQFSAAATIQFSWYSQQRGIDKNKYELISYWHKKKCKTQIAANAIVQISAFATL